MSQLHLRISAIGWLSIFFMHLPAKAACSDDAEAEAIEEHIIVVHFDANRLNSRVYH